MWKCHQCGLLGKTSSIVDMMQKLHERVDKLERDDLQGNLQFLGECRKLLHCNHSILTELRVRIIPIMSRGAGVTIASFPDTTLVLKQQLCRENLAVLNIITPGLTHQRGGVLYELHECDFHLAKRGLENGNISEKDFYHKILAVKKGLLECGQCLSSERTNSIEQYYEKSSMILLKTILEYIVMFSSS